MAIQKQPITINFSQGLDTKTDAKQVSPGKFLSLQNTVFNKGGLLSKRNGYKQLTTLPSTKYSYLTTFNGNLTAIDSNIAAFNADVWTSKGSIQPALIDTLPIIRNNYNQTYADTAIASNGLVCAVYTETVSGSTNYKYTILDSITGQSITGNTTITGATATPRVFLLGGYFIIVFTATAHLQYIAISTTNTSIVSAPTDITNSYVPATTVSWDGYVVSNKLFIAYNTTSGGQAIKLVTLSNTLLLSTPKTYAGEIATMVSVSADLASPQNPIIYVSYYDAISQIGKTLAVDYSLTATLAPTTFITALALGQLTATALNGSTNVFYEVVNNYSYDSAIPSHYIQSKNVTVAGVVGSPFTIIRSLGLASKAFIINDISYFLGAYQSPYQPSYFLINASSSNNGSPVIVAKLAYSNGGGYYTTALPSVTVSNDSARFSYLYKDLIAAVSKATNAPSGTQVAGVYSQTGVNLATIRLTTYKLDSAEIGKDLHISGGFLWMYDGYLPVEHNFFVWPDSVEATWSTSGGNIVAKPDGSTNTNAYYYQVTYEWSDNQGNIFRGAPSIPVAVTTSGSASSGSITLNIPTLRLTYKVANPVKIVIYRWSVAQQSYYQVTSITSPTVNSTVTDSVTYVDTLTDATILGNSLIYTTGGVVEDINAPATNLITLFDTRLFMVDAEDKNLLWFSKQVIENTPVEMSDLFTLYIAPTTAAQGSTGPITALSVLDDKLIIFKQNAIYYINGSGPDNTGANNQYSQPTFITSTVGCSNQHSIVFMPQGLMFQSDKGIWLLGRNLETQYIGAAVEQFNAAIVDSALNIPETNQVRFTLDSGLTLMYDYYYNQWGTFAGIPGVDSCIYQGLHTFIDSYGRAYQETPGLYLDGSNPVLISFTTGWMNLAGLTGYERAYYIYLLGTYITPHNLILDISYDYAQYPTQRTIIYPNNYTGPYGSDSSYGQTSPYGGPGNLEFWKLHLQRQTCTAFQLTLNEQFNPAFGTIAGEGLNLSGLNFVIGIKKGNRPIRGSSAG